jgi:hypothetical protein
MMDGQGSICDPVQERNGPGEDIPVGLSESQAMAPVPVQPPPLLASHAAVRAAASHVASSSTARGRLTGDHPPQIAALRRGDWVKLICGASFEVTHPRPLRYPPELMGLWDNKTEHSTVNWGEGGERTAFHPLTDDGR